MPSWYPPVSVYLWIKWKANKTHENIPASVLKHTGDDIPSTLKQKKAETINKKEKP